MAASRVVVSLPMHEAHLLSDIMKTSLPVVVRRTFCVNCRREQPNSVGQIFSKTRCNSWRKCLTRSHDAELPSSHGDKSLLTAGSFNHSFDHPPQRPATYRQLLPSSSLCLTTQHPSVNEFHVRNFHSKHPLCSFSSDVEATPAPTLDPFKLMETEMGELMQGIQQELKSEEPILEHMSQYYFNGKGKMFRPLVALLMSWACNVHSCGDKSVTWQQKVVAMVSEMIHTGTLVHDDVIDASSTRRGQPSLNMLYGQRQAILTGDYILSQASIAVARTNNPRVISILATILVDLINGEFMQLDSKENENERFAHYFNKTYKKTASLIAKSCKSVAILGNCNDEIVEVAFQYGRNLGIAFQLIDDLLDFTASEREMGKPTASDLKHGLATAPVLFASQECPELHAMIMRRFCEEGDVEFARNAVDKSNGVEQTRLLAIKHSEEAVRNIQNLVDSEARAGLIRLCHILLERTK